jgi:hypothetical protein
VLVAFPSKALGRSSTHVEKICLFTGWCFERERQGSVSGLFLNHISLAVPFPIQLWRLPAKCALLLSSPSLQLILNPKSKPPILLPVFSQSHLRANFDVYVCAWGGGGTKGRCAFGVWLLRSLRVKRGKKGAQKASPQDHRRNYPQPAKGPNQGTS